MSLETPNRIHASAVCFWEVVALDIVENLVTAGFQARSNFSAIAIPNPQAPDWIVLDLVIPIAREEAVVIVQPSVFPDDNDKAGASVGLPLTPIEFPAINLDDFRDDQILIAELQPPDAIDNSAGGGSSVGLRSNFYVMVLAVPPSEEQLFIQPD